MKDLTNQYTYADGSGNSYVISKETLEYKPITKEQSSSGEYSGGSPQKASIKETDFNLIQSAIDKAFQNKAIHIPNRVMMSGLIRIKTGKKEQNFIIQPNCEEQKEIEKLLKDLLK